MARFTYDSGFLYCRTCGKEYQEETCPWYESPGKAGMRYRVCPTKEHNYHLRKKAHNKNSTKYYLEVVKPRLQQDKEVVIRWKQQNRSKKKQ